MKKSNFILLGAIFAFALVCTTSCTKEYIDNPNKTTASTCDTTTVKYSTQIAAIMNTHCVSGCHNATNPSAGLNLSTYAGIKASINDGSSIKDRMNSNSNPMPASGKIADCKIKTVEKWIREGALNN